MNANVICNLNQHCSVTPSSYKITENGKVQLDSEIQPQLNWPIVFHNNQKKENWGRLLNNASFLHFKLYSKDAKYR